MSIQLKVRNVVFVGGFKSSSFDKYFFIKNNIVSESELLAPRNFITDSENTQVVNERFHLLINPFQIILNSNTLELQNEIEDVAGKLIQFGEINSLTAVGFNFNWELSNDKLSIHDLTKQHFYNDNIKILGSYFNNDDSKYGIYASTKYIDSRLKLDVKPITTTRFSKNNMEKYESIQFQFNYHFDLNKDSKPEIVLDYLGDYKRYWEHSNEIISNYK